MDQKVDTGALSTGGGGRGAGPGERAADDESGRGFAFALSAYVIWGLIPLYMKAVADISPLEIVVHRVIWSVPITGLLLVVLGRTSDLKAALRSPRTLALAGVTAALICTNWIVYVYAIVTDRTVEAALGYYINPLLNVVLASIFLRERLSRTQMVAVGLAAVGVAILTIHHGGLPWISLAVALSFGCYGFLRKVLPVGPSQGFMLEVLLLLPAAIALLIYYAATGQGHFGFASGHFGIDTVLLVMAGPLTAAPLILYANGAKRLRFSTLGPMQYVTPTMIFLLAVFVFREPFGLVELGAFACIWTALAIYTVPMVKRRRPKAGR